MLFLPEKLLSINYCPVGIAPFFFILVSFWSKLKDRENERGIVLQSIKKNIFRRAERIAINDEEMLRLKHFLVFCSIGIPTMTFFGVYNYFTEQYVLTGIVVLSTISLILGCLFQLRFPRQKLVYRLCAVVYSFLLLTLFIRFGEGGSRTLWLFTFPLIVFFLLGKKEGASWAVSLLFTAVLLHMLPLEKLLEVSHYPNSFMSRFITVYLIISGITYWFEHFRSSYYQQIRESHRRFREILEHSRDILYRRDLQTGKYQYISKGFSELLGYSQDDIEQLKYQGVGGLIHPEDKKKHDRYVASILLGHGQSEESHAVEYRMQCKDGSYLWFSDKIAVVRDENGQGRYVIGSNREITAVRKARQALETASEQLFTIFDSLDAHIYVADMESYEILFMNNKMKKDFGRNLQGKICWMAFRDGTTPCEHCTNDLLIGRDEKPTGLHEWEGYNPILDRWYNNYDRAIKWVDGRLVRLQIAIDITRIKEVEEERKKTEAVVQRAARLEAIGNLAGGIAHDFNNLLQIILGNLGMLESNEQISADDQEHVKAIDRAATKAIELANRLITFSGGGAPRREKIDLAVFLREVVREAIPNSTVSAEVSADDDLWLTAVDPAQMRTTFSSLLKNSCESMTAGGSIQIHLENHHIAGGQGLREDFVPAGDYLKITIQDDGEGISREQLDKIFDPYYSTKSMGEQKGIGLGLSIVYSIIKRHDGFIDISSKEGDGTTVHIYLKSESQPEDFHSPHYLVAQAKPDDADIVLVMDDEEMIRTLLDSMFISLGYAADIVRDGEEAMVKYKAMLARNRRYKLVIVDLSVAHGMGGMQTLKELQKIDCDVRCVVSSGFSSDPVIADYRSYGFVDVLVKPYSHVDLKALLVEQGVARIAEVPQL